MMTEEHTFYLEAIRCGAPQLSEEEAAHAYRLLRTCDAFGLARWALEEAAAHGEIPNEDDLQNARAELRIQLEEAETALMQFKRRHGIPE